MDELTRTLYLTADGTVAGVAPSKLSPDGAAMIVDADLEAVLEQLAEVDCIVCVHSLAGIDGLALLESVRAERSDLPVLLVDETDDPGIPEDERESAFDLGHTTAEDGTGFGLSIVRTIAEAPGWSVTEGDDGSARIEFREVEAA